MELKLTVKALKKLRVQLGISQEAVARSAKICSSVLSKYEREQENMPGDVHEAYENYLFEVLNGERKISNSQSNVWRYAETQKVAHKRENEELRKARIQIKEYEALLAMYRKEN